MKKIDFCSIGLRLLLIALLFVLFGILGLLYGAFFDVVVSVRYCAVCFGAVIFFIVMALASLVVEMLIN